ncbi:MAG: hypothetical protein LBU65_12925 [Planctomycetaceae bacterium]|nr:hypothetical protein [Planctomycetaceae bacterium]
MPFRSLFGSQCNHQETSLIGLPYVPIQVPFRIISCEGHRGYVQSTPLSPVALDNPITHLKQAPLRALAPSARPSSRYCRVRLYGVRYGELAEPCMKCRFLCGMSVN